MVIVNIYVSTVVQRVDVTDEEVFSLFITVVAYSGLVQIREPHNIKPDPSVISVGITIST